MASTNRIGGRTPCQPTQQDVDKIEADVDSPQNIEITLGKPFLWTQIVACLGVSFIAIMNSVLRGFTGTTLPQMTNPDSSDIFLDKNQASLFSSIFSLGSIIGALLTGPLMVRFGHKRTMLLFIPVLMIGWVILSQASNYARLLTMRVILGICSGVVAPCSMNYLLEISHPSIRGRLMAAPGLFTQVGILFIYSVGSSSLSWRDTSLICGLLPAIFPILILLYVPNSPRWLGTKERFQEAHSSLEFFRGKHCDVTPELEAIREDIYKKGKSLRVSDQFKLLNEKSIVKRLIIISFFYIAVSFQGNVTIVNYSASIFQLAQTGLDEYMSSIVSVSTRILGACVTVALMDRYGRKPLLIISQACAGVFMIAFALFFFLQSIYGDNPRITWIPLTALVLYNFFVTVSIPIMIMIQSELFPSSVRAITSGILVSIMSLSNFLAILTYQYLVDAISPQWTFLFYAMNCFIGALIIAFLIPETKGKTLEEIEMIFT